jgi:SAM-dependent methyltransferase
VTPGGLWADFGSGRGAFTLALADLLGSGGEIVSVDRDERALREQTRALAARYPATTLRTVTADFTRPLKLPPLAGLLMANALHFQRDQDKGPVLDLLRGYLEPGGRLILVEYGTDHGNHWVPYPLSFASWERLAAAHGFAETRLLARRPSRFLGEIYAALSLKGEREGAEPLPEGRSGLLAG